GLGRDISVVEALQILDKTEKKTRKLQKELNQLTKERKEKQELLREISPYRMIPFNVSELLHFQFVKYRFGRIPKEYYEKFEQFVYDNLNMIFYKGLSDEEYVWGVYFVPGVQVDQVDAVLSSLHFERIYLPDSYEGTAEEAYRKLKKESSELRKSIVEVREKKNAVFAEYADELWDARRKLESMTVNFDVRKLAACTREKQTTFYILCGWMVERDAEAFQKEIAGDSQIYCIVEDGRNDVISTPPTKLKNPMFAKPFEMYVRMYGLPSYGEMDPTVFVAITYAFIFGAMFGDLGQGLCLMIGGFALYKFRKMDLAGIIGTAGIFSAIFGVLFGSVFGFENIIEPLWLRPKEAMTTLPFVGSLNTVFVVAIVFGMFLILVTMVFHIANAVKAKRWGDALFDTNGVAGLVFYGSLVAVIILYMSGHALPATVVLVVMFGVPLILLALKEPLTQMLEKQKPHIEGGIPMFIMQTFFELFEVLLSYFSNTLSFVRVGAFAVSHAAMMEVVLMLAGAENGGTGNIVVVVLGNLLVCGLEGLIVGIQVLRLEYYEMFSRFYQGGGREFRPFAARTGGAESGGSVRKEVKVS
ncbi:MAG: ATPase, partial [Lachnospiraceae bacterium]|nr:ATPase [Lachnospiraceae bacterium]